VASLTKPVTAIVALKLVSLGKWNLDEAVYKYWTDPTLPTTHEIKTNNKAYSKPPNGFSELAG
jgi:CubicO group peptidase (beta-lactamase class C family)